MSDYLASVNMKRHWMSEAKTPGIEPEVRRLFVGMAVMYRKHAKEWKALA